MLNRDQLLAFVLLVVLAVRVLVTPMIYLNYELRKDYISKYLCENRSRPELHCDGKCWLAQKIKVAQEQEQQEQERDFLRTLLEVPCIPASFLSGLIIPRIEPQGYFVPTVRTLFSDRPASAIFHPPAL